MAPAKPTISAPQRRMRTFSPSRKMAPSVPNSGARKPIAITSPIGNERDGIEPGQHRQERDRDPQAIEPDLRRLQQARASPGQQRQQHRPPRTALRRNTTTNGCRPAFMATRANTASPANSAIAMVTQITAAMGSLRVSAVTSRGAKSGMMPGFPPTSAPARFWLERVAIRHGDASKHDAARNRMSAMRMRLSSRRLSPGPACRISCADVEQSLQRRGACSNLASLGA